MSPPISNLPPDPVAGGTALPVSWLQSFYKLAEHQPERPAVVTRDLTMSYGELADQSSRIARMLSDAGIGSRHRIGAGLQFGAEWLAAILGILKCGAAYVPLNPSSPGEHLSLVVSSAALDSVLTHSSNKSQFTECATASIEDALSPFIPCDDCGPLEDDLVYMLFTPNGAGGVAAATIKHVRFANTLYTGIEKLALGSELRTMVLGYPESDANQMHLFLPLITGGMLVLDENRAADSACILDLISRNQVTLLNCAPATIARLAESASRDAYSHLSEIRFVASEGGPDAHPAIRQWLGHSSCKARWIEETLMLSHKSPTTRVRCKTSNPTVRSGTSKLKTRPSRSKRHVHR